jgi:hypothetical protein
MNETDYKSPLRLIENEWDELSSSEKALCLSYKRLLERGVKINPALICEINEIHERHPDFHMGCIPCQIALMTDDVSGYLPEGA